ncbi:aminotransferase class V-fold PLP-dependent enzyme, partial [bacterium]|nr:aminotransferase class V-fold PLP-dependent enzyme [bacterium]
MNDRRPQGLDVLRVREDFPILRRMVHARKGKPGKPLVFLDSAASAQKPLQVIQAMDRLMLEDYANVHRGVHYLSQRATDAFEAARRTVARFLGAPNEQTIVFTRNATEAINLVAATYGRKFLQAGDEIIVSVMEHHANIVPWQMLEMEKGVVLKVIPVDDDGVLDLGVYADLLSDRTKLVAVTHCSNVLGTINPVKKIAEMAHAR